MILINTKNAERYHYVMKENSNQARQKEELISLQYCALEGHGYSLLSEVAYYTCLMHIPPC